MEALVQLLIVAIEGKREQFSEIWRRALEEFDNYTKKEEQGMMEGVLFLDGLGILKLHNTNHSEKWSPEESDVRVPSDLLEN